MEKHLTIIGALWILSGALGLLCAFIVFWVLFGVSFIPDMGVEAPIILRTVATGVIIFVAILSVPQILGGAGLMKRKEWARILVLMLAFLALLNFPLGTALGIYSLVILVNAETIQLFKT